MPVRPPVSIAPLARAPLVSIAPSSRIPLVPSRPPVTLRERGAEGPSSVRPVATATFPPSGKPEVAIQVGGIHASGQGVVIRTTLGSCVAACLFDPVARVGGMNHFLLPEDPSGARGPTNFGVHAMDVLLRAVVELGADRRRLEAKLFGGGDLGVSARASVGQKNAAFALAYLADASVRVVAQRLGGPDGMVIAFDTETGKVRLRLVERLPDLVQQEERYVASLHGDTQSAPEGIVLVGAS